MMLTPDELKAALQRYPAKKRSLNTKHLASVALIIRVHEDRGLEILMIERSHREGDPWSGHMAFPGGKKEKNDYDSADTATREVFEEIGLHLRPHQQLGRLSDLITRHHDNKSLMKITPWVYFLEEHHSYRFTLNHEAQSIIWLPLNHLIPEHRKTMQWPLLKRWGLKLNVPLPHYLFENRKIWGLSLMILDELNHLMRCHGYQRLKFSNKIKRLFS